MKALIVFVLASTLSAQVIATGHRKLFTPTGTTNHARQFNGTSDFLKSASASTWASGSTMTISFWLYWNAFSNNDSLAMESSTNFGANSGSFIIDPNDSAGGSFAFNASGTSGLLVCWIARPSAAAWHHYVLIMSGGNTCSAYVDGSAVTTTVHQTASIFTGFTSQFLYVMSRAGTSLFAPGRISQIAFYQGTVNSTDAANLAACGSPTAVTSATLTNYWPINQTSPETPTTGAVNLNVTGTTNVASQCSF